MTVYKAISDLIGNTPLVELTHIEEKEGLEAVSYTHLRAHET